MEDMLSGADTAARERGYAAPSTDVRKAAYEIGNFLTENRAENVAVLDLRGQNPWADFFIVATVTSSRHGEGLKRQIKDFLQENAQKFGLEIMRRPRNALRQSGRAGDDEWRLIDLGTAVIHLMSAQAREFYDLERLWGMEPRESRG